MIVDSGSTRGRRHRRLAAGCVTLAAAATLVAVSAPTPAAAATNSLPTSAGFDLAAPVAKAPLAGLKLKKLKYPNQGPMQGFSFDNANHYLFVVQDHGIVSKGVYQSTATLTINRIPLTGKRRGQVIDTMTVPNAGHGGALGVVPIGSRTQIWLEGKAKKDSYTTASGTHTGYFGTEIDAFYYVPNTPTHPTLPAMGRHFVGNSHITATTDPVHKRIAIRYAVKGTKKFRIAVYPWNNVHDKALLLRVTLPTIGYAKVSGSDKQAVSTAQGFALYGRYFYVYTGDGGKPNNAFVAVDLNKRKSAGVAYAYPPVRTAAFAKTLAGHSSEPQGLGVYRGTGGRVGLYFGFSAHVSAHDSTQTVTIACKVGFNPHVNRAQPATCPA